MSIVGMPGFLCQRPMNGDLYDRFHEEFAAEFFEALRTAGIKRLIDVRLNNSSQLAGFTKRDDLAYFLRELCDASYIHELLLAPEHDLFDEYRKNRGSWEKLG